MESFQFSCARIVYTQHLCAPFQLTYHLKWKIMIRLHFKKTSSNMNQNKLEPEHTASIRNFSFNGQRTLQTVPRAVSLQGRVCDGQRAGKAPVCSAFPSAHLAAEVEAETQVTARERVSLTVPHSYVSRDHVHPPTLPWSEPVNSKKASIL